MGENRTFVSQSNRQAKQLAESTQCKVTVTSLKHPEGVLYFVLIDKLDKRSVLPRCG